MATVFISYRHDEEDTAGRLADSLADAFDVGDDTSIQPGAPWEQEIDQAIAECRVFISVIGRRWLEDANLRRLQQPDDWVRREIASALARPAGQVHIIPVVVGVGTRPREEQLPLALRPLLAHQWATLEHRQWQHGVDNLIAVIRARLAGTAVALSTAVPIPFVLPQLCDRAEPEMQILQMLKAGRNDRTFALVIHGHRAESHWGFLDRMQQERTIESGLRSSATGVEIKHLEWSTVHARSGNYEAMLRFGVAKQVLYDAGANDDALAEWFRLTCGKPHVFALSIPWPATRSVGEAQLEALAAAWRGLFVAPAPDGQPSQFVPLYPMILLVNAPWDEVAAAPARAGAVDALVELPPLEAYHVDAWVASPRVRPYIAGFELLLRDIPRDPTCCHEPGKIHMERFERKVQQILAQR